MREIKFRAWNTKSESMEYEIATGKGYGEDSYILFLGLGETFIIDNDIVKIMQYTGLKDKNSLTEIYEGDIINENGLVIGNIYEMDKRETDTVIQGLGSKTWCETVSRAILLGCRYSE